MPPLLIAFVSLVASALMVAWLAAGGTTEAAGTELSFACGLALLIGIIAVGSMGSAIGAGWIWIVALVATPFPAFLLVLWLAARRARAAARLDIELP